MRTKNSLSSNELADLGVELSNQELATVSGGEGPEEILFYDPRTPTAIGSATMGAGSGR